MVKNTRFQLGLAFLVCGVFFARVGNVWGNHVFVRDANTTITMPQNPQGASYSYLLTEALGGLTFDRPVAFGVEPGATNRLFVIEREGRIIVITNLANPTKTVFLDITNKVHSDFQFGYVEGLSSMAFHPGYATNRQFFITYTLRSNVGGFWHNYNRLARFERTANNLNQGDPNSEVPFIAQLDQGDGHNFNDLHFGPDGYLYMGTGDEGDGGTGDDFNNAQRIDKDFFSAILRIDVDKKPGNLAPNVHVANTQNYFVPVDNPYVGATSFNGLPVVPANVRTEFYAVGFRNVWRMSFDPVTGTLFAGDVGQHGKEEINVVLKGGNYGWAYREGTLVGPKGALPPAVTNVHNPIVEYSPGWGPYEGTAIMGGVVYRGLRVPGLNGAYIFCDYVSGNVWALRYEGETPTPFQRIASQAGIAGFGIDPRNGDVLMADHASGRVLKLDYDTQSSGNLPQTLSGTGVFFNLNTLAVNTGIVPYELNVPFWSDHAAKKRWFSIPDVNLKMTFTAEGNWTFPASTVWIKHFDLELTNGVSSSSRRLETRLLVKNANGIYGVTYRWGTSTSDAVLVPEEGLDETFLIYSNGIVRTQVWHYPSRNECLACHTPVGGYALGFNTPQLNRTFNYGIITNQIYALSDAGYFNSAIPDLFSLRALAHHTNSLYSREYRVRSYLTANCVQCHQPGGIGGGFWDARITTPLSSAGIIHGLLQNYHGDGFNRVVVPGNASRSMLLSRISSSNSTRMPPLGSTVLNHEAISLLTEWIAGDLAGYQTFAEWQTNFFGSSSLPSAAANADPDNDATSNYLEYLLSLNPTNSTDGWKPAIQTANDTATISFLQVSNRGFELQFATNLNHPVTWMRLDDPGNQVNFSSSTHTNAFHDAVDNNGHRFYRFRVFEP